MAKTMNVPQAEAPARREYASFKGVDLVSPPSMVDPSRSPDAVNVYKDYSSTSGQAIETRKGFVKLGEFSENINGIHRLNNRVYLHVGTNLYLWNSSGIPGEIPDNLSPVSTALADNESISFNFDDKMYVLDGENYFVCNGNTFEEVEGYIPTTRINSDPNGANGTDYQGVNFLSEYRKNTFVGDGTSIEFYVDGYPEDVLTAEVDGEAVEVSSYSQENGTVTLSEAPAAPATTGEANVTITYKQTVSGNADKIKKCTVTKVFDNRVFFTGNYEHKGILFHSELEDPTYFRDDSFYNDGDETEIASLVIYANNIVAIKKDGGSASPKVFYHTPSLDYELGKVYPCSTSEIFLGTNLKGVNFNDTVCFTTSRGLDSVYWGNSKSSLWHKSSLVDPQLANSVLCDMEVWNNYLVILASNGKAFLADSRQVHNMFGTYEYEWYVWDSLKCEDKAAKRLFVYDETLYFTTDNAICKFEGTNDDGNVINSYWTTPEDVFSYPAYLKTVTKRGAVAFVKQVPNSEINISCSTDKEIDSLLYSRTTSGFDFNNFREMIETGTVNFATSIRGTRFFKIKKKKIQHFSLKFFSDKKDKPFGIYGAVLEFNIKKYAKGE